jgi:hypothetical protein
MIFQEMTGKSYSAFGVIGCIVLNRMVDFEGSKPIAHCNSFKSFGIT